MLDYLSGDTPPAALSRPQSTINQHWLNLPETSVITSPLTYFDELLREDQVQQQAQALRDLIDIQRRHRHWQEKLRLYTELVEQKRARRPSGPNSCCSPSCLPSTSNCSNRASSWPNACARSTPATRFWPWPIHRPGN